MLNRRNSKMEPVKQKRMLRMLPKIRARRLLLLQLKETSQIASNLEWTESLPIKR